MGIYFSSMFAVLFNDVITGWFLCTFVCHNASVDFSTLQKSSVVSQAMAM